MGKSNLLTEKRRNFLNQLYNIIDNQFKKQEEDFIIEEDKDKKIIEENIKKIIEELENNSDYIQRIFIDSPWGTGKSYFCSALTEKINNENEKKKESEKKEIKLIRINAWETDYFSDPMKSLIGEISQHIRLSKETKEKFKQLAKNGAYLLIKYIVNNLLGIDDNEIKKIEELSKEVGKFKSFEIEDYTNYKNLVRDFKTSLIRNEKDLKLIVIDELDRCKPDYAIELLETIKHFFGVKNIIFVFLVNMDQLKSIVSTSYLSVDRCSEYFEKFYDVKFSLPVLDYEDFLRIEYNEYNNLDIYKTTRENNEIISENVNALYESLFLEGFSSNCDPEKIAPRNFIKSFKKFKLLLLSLSEDEKSCYPLMIVLILYFVRAEFLVKDKINKEKIEIEENLSIPLLYLRTFFEKNNSTLYNKLISERELNTNIRVKLKFLQSPFDDFYKIFYLVLMTKGKEKEYDSELQIEVPKHILGCISNYPSFELVKININYNTIVFKEVGYLTTQNYMKYISRIRIPEQLPTGIIIPSQFIRNLSTNVFKIELPNNFAYETGILEEWASEKYNFVID